MNMAYKKYREMKVYEASGYQYKRTPSIVLKGKWLSDLGFDIGEQIEVKCEDGRLVITKANEIWQCEQERFIYSKQKEKVLETVRNLEYNKSVELYNNIRKKGKNGQSSKWAYYYCKCILNGKKDVPQKFVQADAINVTGQSLNQKLTKVAKNKRKK